MDNYDHDSQNSDGKDSETVENSGSDIELISDRPSEGHLQDALLYAMMGAVRNEEVALVEAPPGIGKTRSVSMLAERLFKPLTIFTKLKRNQKQHVERTEEIGVPGTLAPSYDNCPCLGEGPEFENDPAAEKARKALVELGWTVNHIHDAFDLPCERGSNICEYQNKKERVEGVRREPNGVIVGNPVQANNSGNIALPKDIGRVGVLDEPAFDSFVEEFSSDDELSPAEIAQAYINTLDEFPINDINKADRVDDTTKQRALERLEDEGLDQGDHRKSVGKFHAKAPLVAYALIAAEPVENGKFSVVELPANRRAVIEDGWGSATTLTLVDIPDISGFDAIIALDATPCLPEWQAVLGDDITHYRLLSDEERNRYLWVDEGYEFVQLHNHVWPASGGTNINYEKAEAYLRAIYRKHGERPDLVTSKKAKRELESRGMDNLWNRDIHFGDLRSRNDLSDSDILVVLGSPSRSDDDIRRRALLLGGDPEMDDEVVRAEERDFNDEIANGLVESHRDTVFQAAMRAGRDHDVEATVYIATGMVPEWLETRKVGEWVQADTSRFDACPGSNLRTDTQRAIIKAVRGADGITMGEWQERANEIIDRPNNASDIHQDTIRDVRDDLEDKGYLERRGRKYFDTDLDRANPTGDVVLTPVSGINGSTPYNNTTMGVTQIIVDDPPTDDPRWPWWKYDLDRWAEEKRKQNALRWRNIQEFGDPRHCCRAH